MNTCKNIIANSGIKFGTSGARGLAEDFTKDVCAAFTVAFIETIKQEFNFETIVFAMDRRPSSPAILQYCLSVASSMGFEVEDQGVLPTPALAYYAMQQNFPCVMITGSHIPFDRNGIKFYRPDGEITKTDERTIINCLTEIPSFSLLQTERKVSALDAYTKRYLTYFDDNLLKGLSIGIYEHSSAGRDIYANLFANFGALVTRLERSDTFVPIDTEAVSEHDKSKAKTWQDEYKFDAIFSTDGDGDRPLVANEKGEWLRGDTLCLLAAMGLEIDNLAFPVSCNSAIEETNVFGEIIRTKIGSPYVIEAFGEFECKSAAIAGFEANGGFFLASEVKHNEKALAQLPTRDAVLPFLAVLALAKKQGLTISQLQDSLPKRFTDADRLVNFEREKSLLIIRSLEQDVTSLEEALMIGSVISKNVLDGLRLTFENKDIVHFRPSGNAPELRCYVESNTPKHANMLLTNAIKYLKYV